MYEVCSIVFCKDSAFLRNKKFAPVFYCIQAGGKTVNGLQSGMPCAVSVYFSLQVCKVGL